MMHVRWCDDALRLRIGDDVFMSSDDVNTNDRDDMMMHLLFITHANFVMNSSCYDTWHLQLTSYSSLVVTPFQRS
jgi:hypothetical protein